LRIIPFLTSPSSLLPRLCAGCLNFKQLFLPNPSDDLLSKAAARIADSDVLYQQATKGAFFSSSSSLFYPSSRRTRTHLTLLQYYTHPLVCTVLGFQLSRLMYLTVVSCMVFGFKAGANGITLGEAHTAATVLDLPAWAFAKKIVNNQHFEL
jgi:hypothetical protein